MLRISAKYLAKELNFCPYCSSDKLNDLGTDKNGLTLITCSKCHDKFFILTGQRRTDNWWQDWWNRVILRKGKKNDI